MQIIYTLHVGTPCWEYMCCSIIRSKRRAIQVLMLVFPSCQYELESKVQLGIYSLIAFEPILSA